MSASVDRAAPRGHERAALPIDGGRWLHAAVLLVALTSFASSTARAQDARACSTEIRGWVTACAATNASLAIESCPPGHLVVRLGPNRLRVDVAHAVGGEFATVGGMGLSPIGSFAVWSEVAQIDRDAFDALTQCARADPRVLARALATRPVRGQQVGIREVARTNGTPWRAALGSLLALLVLVRRYGLRALAVRALPLVALSVAVFVARRFFVPEMYFHQNGQGALWIDHARGEPSAYGPGYAQIFSWAAARARDPDGAVFGVQCALAALVPAAAFVVARGVGAARVVAWAAAAAVLVSPLMTRLAQSESYFAACAALLALSAAVLVSTASVRGVALSEKSAPPAAAAGADSGVWWRVMGAAAAGLFVSQAALVHPVCWLAGAVLPAILALCPGTPKARATRVLMATAIIGAVVLVTAGADLLDVLQGSLGAQWLGSAGVDSGHLPSAPPLPLVIGAAALLIAARMPRLRYVCLPTLVLCVVGIVDWRGNLLGAAPPWVHQAYDWLYAAPVLACVCVLLQEVAALVRPGDICAPWWTASALLAASLVWYATSWNASTTIPTDAREAQLVRGWRAHLPAGAVVAHLERARDQIVGLPIYDGPTVRLTTDEPPGDLQSAGNEVYYYRSSLCTTARGRAYCDAIDRGYRLAPVATAVLPAVPSMRSFRYDRDEVRVGLYRLRERRSGSMTDDGSSERRDGE